MDENILHEIKQAQTIRTVLNHRVMNMRKELAKITELDDLYMVKISKIIDKLLQGEN
jgi:hypothetical protein